MTDGKPLHVIGVSPSWDHWKSILHISKQLIFDCVCYLCNIWGEKNILLLLNLCKVSHLGGRQFSSKGEMNRESERGEEESGERRSAK